MKPKIDWLTVMFFLFAIGAVALLAARDVEIQALKQKQAVCEALREASK